MNPPTNQGETLLPANTPTLACPWCGIADLAVESEQCCDRIITGVDDNNGPVYWAECQRCGARSPLVGWAADAIPKWNTRAPAIPTDALRLARLTWALKDALSACAYIEQAHGKLYGVGWDRLESYRKEFAVELDKAEALAALGGGQ